MRHCLGLVGVELHSQCALQQDCTVWVWPTRQEVKAGRDRWASVLSICTVGAESQPVPGFACAVHDVFFARRTVISTCVGLGRTQRSKRFSLLNSRVDCTTCRHLPLPQNMWCAAAVVAAATAVIAVQCVCSCLWIEPVAVKYSCVQPVACVLFLSVCLSVCLSAVTESGLVALSHCQQNPRLGVWLQGLHVSVS